MRIVETMIMMFIGSFIIQYLLMPAIMVNEIKYVTNSIGKMYMSVLMALFMVLLEVIMHDHHYNVVSKNMYIGLGLLIGLFIYLYRKQSAINDKQYLEGMIEHHSMALLISKQILEKTNSYDVSKLAKSIVQTQEDEIHEMSKIINKINQKQ
jgi:hypothetical protein